MKIRIILSLLTIVAITSFNTGCSSLVADPNNPNAPQTIQRISTAAIADRLSLG
jgi:hypothetical protein